MHCSKPGEQCTYTQNGAFEYELCIASAVCGVLLGEKGIV